MSIVSPARDFILQCDYYSNKLDGSKQDSDTLVVNGNYSSFKVVNNTLVVQPGTMCESAREPMIYYRGKVPFERVVILSKSGNISLDALHWLGSQQVSILMLDYKGDVVYSMLPEVASNAHMRRVQYMMDDHKATRIACQLVREKTASQLETVKAHTELSHREYLMDLLQMGMSELARPDYRFDDMNYIRTYEARLASVYFDAFVDVPLTWRKSDRKVIPPHWQRITNRTSGLSDKNARHATNPYHTALNYIYAVWQHQLLGYIHASGLDAACGVLHADRNGRDSLLYDLFEPFRAVADEQVLSFFNRNTLKKGDITLFPSGEIALNPELARYLVTSTAIDARKLQSCVSWFKNEILTA